MKKFYHIWIKYESDPRYTYVASFVFSSLDTFDLITKDREKRTQKQISFKTRPLPHWTKPSLLKSIQSHNDKTYLLSIMHSETPPRDKQGNTSSSIILPRFFWLSQNDTLNLITRGKTVSFAFPESRCLPGRNREKHWDNLTSSRPVIKCIVP